MQTFASSKTRIYSVFWGISSIKKKMQHHILFSEETGMHFKVYSSRTSHHIHLIWRSALVKCTCMHMANRRKKESALTKALWFGISRKARTKLQSNEQVPKPKVFALPANYAEAKASLSPLSLFFPLRGSSKTAPFSRIVHVYLEAARCRTVHRGWWESCDVNSGLGILLSVSHCPLQVLWYSTALCSGITESLPLHFIE
jgi:hypothetical protein